MVKGRKSRMDLRREAEAVEARKQDEDVETEGGEEEEEEEEADAEGEAGADDEDAKPKKKKAKKVAVKKPAAAKKPATKRSRAAKEVRTRAVWVVYDNGSKVVDKFPYNQRAEADALLAKKIEEKKGTFYINLVKEEIKD